MPTGKFDRPLQWRDKWKGRLFSDVLELDTNRKRAQTVWGRQVNIRIPPHLNRLLHDVAQARNITVAGYIRRSLARQMARDLGIDWKDIIKHSPYPAEYGKIRPPEKYGKRLPGGNKGFEEFAPDDGSGYGNWEN